MNINRGIFAAAVTVLSAGAATGVAVAQQLEEVVVTARRITESITDAPLAVAVMDGDFIEDQGITSMQDILELTPGSTWQQFTKAQPSFTIRGIPAGTYGNSSLESSAQLVVDGVAQTKAFMMTPDVFDLERIEVMRGPQGTTFGRNATIGMVHMITARPENEFGAAINAEAGDLGLAGISGHVTGPMGDTTSGRVAWNFREWDGVMEDTLTGAPLEASEQRSIRGSLLIQPNDNFSAYLKAEYNDLDEMPTVRTGDRSGGAGEEWLSAARYYTPYVDTSNPWTGQQSSNPDGGSFFVDRQMTFLTAELVWNVNDTTITWLSGYQDGDHETFQDVFGSPEALQDQNVINQGTVLSTELRIDNSASGNAFTWLGGLYLLEDDEYRHETNNGNPERTSEGGFYNCSGKIAPCAGPSWLVNIGDASTSGLGVFGELSFDLSDSWNLTVGGRYSDDSRNYDYEVQGWGNVAGLAAVGLDGDRDCADNFVAVTDPDPQAGGFTCGTEGAPMGFAQSLSRDFDNFSSKVSLTYSVNDNNNVYFLYSEGFKAGGFQHDARSAAQLNSGLVDDETATNYEIGWKGSYDSVRFAVTYFSMEQEGAQLNNLISVGTGFTTHVINADGIENDGLEFEATWAATENLTIGGSIASYDPVFVNAIQGSMLDLMTGLLVGEDISGQSASNAPDGTYAVYANYEWNLSGGSVITLRGDIMHRNSTYGRAGATDRDSLTIDGTREMYLRPELDKYGLNLGWTSASGGTTIELWGRNLDDDNDWINFGPGSPATFARGTVGPAGLAPAVVARPRGVSGRKQVGVTARFLF